MKRPFRYGMCILTFAAGFALVLSSHGQPPAPAAKDIEQLVEHDVKSIQTVLAKPKFDMKAQGKVKAAAIMIAVYAESMKSPKYDALREQALKLAKAAGDGKADVAKKLAADLSMNMKGDPALKAGVVAFDKHSDLLTIMKQFSAERFGGFALEKAIEDLVESKGPADDKEAARIALMALKVGMIGKVAHHFGPESDQGKKTKKAWSEFTTQMQTAAHELARAAQMRKDAEIGNLANRLSMTCVKCHDVFRIVD